MSSKNVDGLSSLPKILQLSLGHSKKPSNGMFFSMFSLTWGVIARATYKFPLIVSMFFVLVAGSLLYFASETTNSLLQILSILSLVLLIPALLSFIYSSAINGLLAICMFLAVGSIFLEKNGYLPREGIVKMTERKFKINSFNVDNTRDENLINSFLNYKLTQTALPFKDHFANNGIDLDKCFNISSVNNRLVACIQNKEYMVWVKDEVHFDDKLLLPKFDMWLPANKKAKEIYQKISSIDVDQFNFRLDETTLANEEYDISKSKQQNFFKDLRAQVFSKYINSKWQESKNCDPKRNVTKCSYLSDVPFRTSMPYNDIILMSHMFLVVHNDQTGTLDLKIRKTAFTEEEFKNILKFIFEYKSLNLSQEMKDQFLADTTQFTEMIIGIEYYNNGCVENALTKHSFVKPIYGNFKIDYVECKDSKEYIDLSIDAKTYDTFSNSKELQAFTKKVEGLI